MTLLWIANPAAAATAQASTSQSKVLLERILIENIIPFWYPGCIDREYGGFRLNHDRDGRWAGPAPKALVTQSRTVWFFARLANSPFGKPEYLETALHGFELLRDKMWDQEHGGFYWSVDFEGAVPVQEGKHVYGQAFVIYALAELYRASSRPEVLDLARQTFSVLESRAHDPQYGGYRESFTRAWDPLEDNEASYLGPPNRLKTMNSHLHLMEAFSEFYRVSRDVFVRERLLELIFIQSNAVVRKGLGACSDRHQRDWTPVTADEQGIVSFGHDLENVWLLMEASESAGLSDSALLDLYRSLFSYALRYGQDREKGGFFYYGPFNSPATELQKSWWVQAEALIGALRMARRTGDQAYHRLFESTLQWISGHQVDWSNGEWFATVHPDGTTAGAKSGPWKSPYHNGRAVLECLRLLE